MKGVPFDKFGGFVHPSDLPLAGGGTYTSGGMTLRDWFAGQALAGMCAYSGRVFGDDARDLMKDRAANAYAHADAMLAERSKE